MGGFSGAIASQASRDIFTGLSTGWKIGAGYNNAKYNASAMRNQAAAIQAQANLDIGFQSELIAARYRRQYRDLKYQQEMQMSQNRVNALKRGITGASAANVLGSYAAKGKRNLQTLYYNAAMQLGAAAHQISSQSISRVSALEEKARQYDWQANMVLIGGAVNFATGYFKNNFPSSQADPTSYEDDELTPTDNGRDSGNSEGLSALGLGMGNFGLPNFGG